MKTPTAEDVQAACALLRMVADLDGDVPLVEKIADRVDRIFDQWLRQFEDED